MKKLAIFDLDGTILYTLEDLENALNYALSIHDFPARTREEVRCFVGNGIRKLVERGCGDAASIEAVDAVHHSFMEHYTAHCFDTTRPYGGVLELMKSLRRNGLKIAVVSNKADAAVKALCQRFFPGLVNYAVGERDDVRRKPAPDSVFAALEALEMSACEAVYIGDSEVDIETAANAGMDCVSVTWGFKDREFLVKKGAILLIDTPDELLRYI